MALTQTERWHLATFERYSPEWWREWRRIKGESYRVYQRYYQGARRLLAKRRRAKGASDG